MNANRKGSRDSVGLVSQKFFELELRLDGIVWLKRTPSAYETIADIHLAYDHFLAAVDDWVLERRIASGKLGTRERTPIGWLYDLRSAPSQRNDSAFEAAILARRPDLLKRSPLLVVLVGTAAGRMQIRRIAQGNKAELRVSSDFVDAIDWLQRELATLTPAARP